MGDLSDFQRGQIVGAHLVGSSLTKTATLLSASRAAVFKVMAAHTNYGETSSTERNSGRNPKRSEGDRRELKRIISKNHRTTIAKIRAELNTHLKDSVYTKKAPEKLYKSNIHGTDAIAKLLITGNNAKR